MRHYKTSIISSVIAGILICGMLAACGEAEKQQGGLQNNIDANPSVSDSAAPETEQTPPETDHPETTPDEPSPDETEPEVDENLPDENIPDEEEPDDDVAAPGTAEQEPEAEPEEDADDTLATIIVDTATAQLGVPYVYGGSSPEDGFDSSGFTYYCVRAAGIDFPRQTGLQVEAGTKISYADLAPGDIAYFSAEPGGNASFCGVYVGGGLIIYAPVPGDNVKTAIITTNYWTSRFVTGVRVAH